MKKFIIIMIIFVSLFGFADTTINSNSTIYVENRNKKFYRVFYKNVRWTKSFMVAYIYNNKVSYYNYNSNLDTLYDIASITKTFTALTILQLHEKGELNIDFPVSKYLPYYDTRVTIRHLITHSSFFPYGEGSSYSNLNYVLLKDIIELVTGNKYYEEIKKRFFIPLRMYTSSAIYSNGAGNIMSTLKDLINYSRMFINKGRFNNKQIISKQVYDLMLETAKERKYIKWYWSSGGFEVFTENKQMTSFYKSGRWYYSVSGIEIFPDKEKAVLYIGSPKNCLSPWVVEWRNRFWRFIRYKIIIEDRIW